MSCRSVRLAGLAILASALSGGPALAQSGEGAAQADKEVMRLPAPLSFGKLGVEDGLPQATVPAIVQDETGFMWFGTQGGLVRYDGHRMLTYRTEEGDASTLSSDFVHALAAGEGGAIWAGTPEDGVNLYDPTTNTFTRHRFDSGDDGGISSEGVNAIHRDSGGRTWFAMTGGGLNRYNEEAGRFEHYLEAPLDSRIFAIAEDSEGTLWLGSEERGLVRLDPDTEEMSSYPLRVDGRELAFPLTSVKVGDEGRGRVWAGTAEGGLYAFDPATETFEAYRHVAGDSRSLSHDHVTSLLEDASGNLWVGTYNGLNRYEEESNSFAQYHHQPNNPASLPYPRVLSLYQDREGILWVGTLGGGIGKVDQLRRNLALYRTKSYSPLSFAEDSEGHLWVGSVNGGLFEFEREADRYTNYKVLENPQTGDSLPLEQYVINDIVVDSLGVLWMGLTDGGGLVAFDPTSGRFRQYLLFEDNPQFATPSVESIEEGPQGDFWLGTWGGGLVQFDPDREEATAYTSSATDISSDFFYVVYQDPEKPNILWGGTAQGGLNRVDLDEGTADVFLHDSEDPKSLSHDDVVSVHRDSKGVWVGTYGGGLNRLNPATGEAERFTSSSSGLTSDVVWGILPDKSGGLWLSTNGGGLLRFQPGKGEFERYAAADGLQGDQFAQGAHGRSSSGELFFGGPGGFNAFFPERLERTTQVPPVAITGLNLLNQQIKLDRPLKDLPEDVEISHDDSFVLNFAALSFAAPEENQYVYKLEGFDDGWIESEHPFATYTKLGGGDYTFRVRAANRDGVWNEEGVALSFSVSPPFWLSWWAYSLYAALVAGAIFAGLRFQRQKIRRLEQEGRLMAVERDLALTGAVQTGFLPRQNEVAADPFRLYGFYRPAEACSGDWWWHERLEDGTHFVLVGDVTGHGPGPAMVTAAVATAFRVVSGIGGQRDTLQKLRILNEEVLRVGDRKYQMTAAVMELDSSTGRYAFYSAGGPPMLRLGSQGRPRSVPCRGTPLGTEGFEVGQTEGQLEAGDRLLLYTDGIPELELPNGRLLGMRRFSRLFEGTRGLGLGDAATSIVQRADEVRQGNTQEDDWTFTLVEWTGTDALSR